VAKSGESARIVGMIGLSARRLGVSVGVALVALACGGGASAKGLDEVGKLRRAIVDLRETYGERYLGGGGFLRRLDGLSGPQVRKAGDWRKRFDELRLEALSANPALSGQLLIVKRKAKNPIRDIAIPAPHESYAGFERGGYDNEIALVDLDHPDAEWKTVIRPEDQGYVGEIEVHWDAEHFLFTRSDKTNWKLWEIDVDGSGLRQVSRTADDIDCFDACYLPDENIVFGSTASFQSVPCHHGKMPPSLLYRMAPDGTRMRQLCFDQDMDANPVVLPNGQVLYSRWDYTGINHIYMRQLMAMNPDGTRQRAIYGSNSWFPNSLFFFKPLPGEGSRMVSILSGYHGVPRMGWLVVLDPASGWREGAGIETRISGRGDPVRPVIKDAAVNEDRPLFLHPYPLTAKHFLVAGLERGAKRWKIYLADVFDNLVPLLEDPEYSLIEPELVRPRKRPPVLADRVDPSRDDAEIYIQDIHSGPGLNGVPRGTVKELRVVGYHFGYRGLAGSDKVGYGGPWDVMRILGTTPVEEDGSAYFRVPANTPVALQPLDAEGKAVQLMRSWLTGMPGERVSCVGCHEGPSEASPPVPTRASQRQARELEPWFGPARGFDFAREVQPVLNRRCAGCHDGKEAAPDLRPEELVKNRKSWPIGYPERLDPEMAKATNKRMTYTPAYDELIHYIRRPGIEDDVSLLVPGEYHADTSPLIQMLRKGHHGVELDDEEWERLVTWIDLNAPCHGTWGDIFPVPKGAHQRRLDCWKEYGGPAIDPEVVPSGSVKQRPFEKPPERKEAGEPKLASWPWSDGEAMRKQQAAGQARKSLDLGGGIRLELARIPAGKFIMGSSDGADDERRREVKAVDGFWMGTCEVSNAQFLQFDPAHDPGYYARRLSRPDGRGLSLAGAEQPAVRVSWQQAVEYCGWLSEKTGLRFSLPTEVQWEYACRAGTVEAMWFGPAGSDFSRSANLADRIFSRGVMTPQKVHPETTTQWSGGVPHLVLEGAKLAESKFSDGFSVTASVGSFEPNPWGLHDMHGNAAEWTDTPVNGGGRRVVRGGSFFDPPRRSKSGSRVDFPEWQRLFNVGFRVTCQAP